MIKVLSHGDVRSVLNPVTQEWTDVVNIQFFEEGRGGANDALSTSNAALSAAIGEEVGLALLRTHTQPVLLGQEGKFPVGKEFPNLFINRKMFSTPQMTQQNGVAVRMIEGKPTYFTTEIADRMKEDEDLRLDNNVLAGIAPEHFKGAVVGAAIVKTLESRPKVSQQGQPGAQQTQLEGQPGLETSGLGKSGS